MKKYIFLILGIFFILTGCNNSYYGVNYGKLYDNEPIQVIDSLCTVYSIPSLNWSTKTYKEKISGTYVTTNVQTALYRTSKDSTFIITQTTYHFKNNDIKYGLQWRIEKELNTNF